ncbi:hypothetical protein SAMD00079811_58170 [Scytonema sp. HK-05]|nr:hypothetical protein SAMD00079811_58170 [Scytonema sp. HK-05]
MLLFSDKYVLRSIEELKHQKITDERSNRENRYRKICATQLAAK